MKTLLAIQVSPRYEYSASRKLTNHFVTEWQLAHPGGRVVIRDLVKTDLPFVDMAWIQGAYTPPETHTPEASAAIKVSNDLVAELQAADQVVIGTPMHNFSIPARLKAYIDHVVRVGVTVSASNEGLLKAESADVILASGGDFSPGSPVHKYDQASGYLRQLLTWLGIADINIILAARARAGANGETALENYGDIVAAAATRDRPVAVAEAA